MRKLAAAVLLFPFLFTGSAFAARTAPTLPDAPAIKGANIPANGTYASLWQNPSLLGAVPFASNETSTAAFVPIQVSTNPGLLYALPVTSGTVNGYCIALDSDSVTGYTQSLAGLVTMAQSGKRIAGDCFTRPIIGDTVLSRGGCFPALDAGAPAQYAHGLVIMCTQALNAVAYTRRQDGLPGR